MALADIKALQIGHLARQDAILLLWSTGAMLPQGVGTGYRVRTSHEPVLSRKPDEFYRMVIERTPDQDRCDLFSRGTRPGFDGWGREHGKFDLVT